MSAEWSSQAGARRTYSDALAARQGHPGLQVVVRWTVGRAGPSSGAESNVGPTADRPHFGHHLFRACEPGNIFHTDRHTDIDYDSVQHRHVHRVLQPHRLTSSLWGDSRVDAEPPLFVVVVHASARDPGGRAHTCCRPAQAVRAHRRPGLRSVFARGRRESRGLPGLGSQRGEERGDKTQKKITSWVGMGIYRRACATSTSPGVSSRHGRGRGLDEARGAKKGEGSLESSRDNPLRCGGGRSLTGHGGGRGNAVRVLSSGLRSTKEGVFVSRVGTRPAVPPKERQGP